MTRSLALILAAAAMLLLPPSAGLNAEPGQKKFPVELDQSLLDRWFILAPGWFRLAKASQAAPDARHVFEQRFRKMCGEAGFASYSQCRGVTAYIGMIIGACDRNTRSFRDPVVLMRRELARIEDDTSMPTAERDRQIAKLRRILATLPERLPPEHIALMTAHRDRIFEIVLEAWQ